ncbi:hypothetical protein S83_067008, partial [Arachis hypogaea]
KSPSSLELVRRGGQAIVNCEVELVFASEKGCVVHCKDGSKEMYDCYIIATHALDTLRLLGEEATYDERRILGAFQYAYNDIFLHHDTNLLPRNPSAWSGWNFLGCNNNKVCITYWLNILQNLSETRLPFLITLNPNYIPKKILFLSGQLDIQFHQLLHSKLHKSLKNFKEKEEFGFAVPTK